MKAKKLRQFWCDLFDSHEWLFKRAYYKEGIPYNLYKCKKCGKTKNEPTPIMIPTVFSFPRTTIDPKKVQKR